VIRHGRTAQLVIDTIDPLPYGLPQPPPAAAAPARTSRFSTASNRSDAAATPPSGDRWTGDSPDSFLRHYENRSSRSF